MTEEIKEILKYIDQFVYVDQTYNDIKLSKIDTKLILGHITSLQEENERLKEENILLKASEPMSKIAEDYGYKSRCEKAIEYIKDKGLYEEELDIFNDDINYNELDDLLNILNGSGNNE